MITDAERGISTPKERQMQYKKISMIEMEIEKEKHLIQIISNQRLNLTVLKLPPDPEMDKQLRQHMHSFYCLILRYINNHHRLGLDEYKMILNNAAEIDRMPGMNRKISRKMVSDIHIAVREREKTKLSWLLKKLSTATKRSTDENLARSRNFPLWQKAARESLSILMSIPVESPAEAEEAAQLDRIAEELSQYEAIYQKRRSRRIADIEWEMGNQIVDFTNPYGRVQKNLDTDIFVRPNSRGTSDRGVN